MNGPEIFSLIVEKKKRIEELIDPTIFVLNKEVVELQNDIIKLQEECPHEYKNGTCKYCEKEEK